MALPFLWFFASIFFGALVLYDYIVEKQWTEDYKKRNSADDFL